MVGEVYSFENHQICGYSLKDIVKKICNRDVRSYMLFILNKSQYITREQTEIITYNNISYTSYITIQCYQKKGILINLILNNQFINRLPYSNIYITIMHQENYEYIRKFVLLDKKICLSRIYLNMLNSGYNLFFHIQAYNTLCNDNYYVSLSYKIDDLIQHILASAFIEHYDDIHVKYERNGIGVIKENNPMIRIYFMRENSNIYILEITNDHSKNNISKKLKSAENRYKEKENLKDIFDIKDNKCLNKT